MNDHSRTINEQRNHKMELEGSLMSSENNFANLNMNFKQLSEEYAKVCKTLEEKDKSLCEANDRIHDLESLLSASEATNADLVTRLKASTEENNNNKSYYLDATRKLNDSREGEAHLQAELSTCQTNNDNLQTQVNNLTATSNKQANTIRDLQAECAKLNQDLDRMTDKFNTDEATIAS